ncbi:hypothetical protein J2S71_002034 [Olsenella profusa DSM 13989]|nr:hypothetical protein [Olsenella profusa DSM 13989]
MRVPFLCVEENISYGTRALRGSAYDAIHFLHGRDGGVWHPTSVMTKGGGRVTMTEDGCDSHDVNAGVRVRVAKMSRRS